MNEIINLLNQIIIIEEALKTPLIEQIHYNRLHSFRNYYIDTIKFNPLLLKNATPLVYYPNSINETSFDVLSDILKKELRFIRELIDERKRLEDNKIQDIYNQKINESLSKIKIVRFKLDEVLQSLDEI